MIYHLAFSKINDAHEGLYIHDIFQQFHGIEGLHDQDFYEFTIVIKGEGFHHINGHRQSIRPGHLILIRPRDVHTMELIGPPPLFMRNVVISASLWKESTSLLLTPKQVRILTRPRLSPLAFLGPELLRTLEQGVIQLSRRDSKRLLFARLFCDVLMQCLQDGPPPALLLSPPLKQALECLNSSENLREGLAAMVRAAGCSREHLARELKRVTGRTPTDWILEKRLTRACELLLASNSKIIDIAFDAGFNHLGYFNRTFARFKGVPPQRWRIQQRTQQFQPHQFLGES